MFRILFVSMVTLASAAMAESPPRQSDSDARFFPDSTALYAELPDPKSLLSLVLDHPLREKIESLEPYRAATNSTPYKQFLLGRTVVEAQVQMPWREALETFLAQGAAIGLDRRTEGLAIIIHGKDEASMQLLRDKLIEFAKLRPNPDRIKEGEYRGIKVHQVDNIALAVHGERILFTNQKDLGKQIVDQMLDGGSSLADQPRFQSALEVRGNDLIAWGYADVEAIRDAGVARNVFQDQINHPVAELIFGGIQSSLQKTPYATASLRADSSQLDLVLGMPHQADWLPESREYYFGPDGSGHAPQMPSLPETLFSLSTYRDFSEMWLRAGDLFNADMNDELAKADATLTTLFAGRDFGEDILGSFQPEVGFIAVRQDFTDISPKPAIRLPAFAAIFELREPESMTRELRRTFQSLIGFLNVVGAQNGQQQLELGMDTAGSGGQLVTATYVAEDDEQDADDAKIYFNFSPSIGFVGNRCVIASSKSLAKALTELGDSDQPTIEVNTKANLDAQVLRDVLADNRSQLVAQNMLEEGHSREEAEAAIDLLLQVLDYVHGASASLETEDGHLKLKLSFEVSS